MFKCGLASRLTGCHPANRGRHQRKLPIRCTFSRHCCPTSGMYAAKSTNRHSHASVLLCSDAFDATALAHRALARRHTRIGRAQPAHSAPRSDQLSPLVSAAVMTSAMVAAASCPTCISIRAAIAGRSRQLRRQPLPTPRLRRQQSRRPARRSSRPSTSGTSCSRCRAASRSSRIRRPASLGLAAGPSPPMVCAWDGNASQKQACSAASYSLAYQGAFKESSHLRSCSFCHAERVAALTPLRVKFASEDGQVLMMIPAAAQSPASSLT